MKLIILLQIIININHGHENKKVFCFGNKINNIFANYKYQSWPLKYKKIFCLYTSSLGYLGPGSGGPHCFLTEPIQRQKHEQNKIHVKP